MSPRENPPKPKPGEPGDLPRGRSRMRTFRGLDPLEEVESELGAKKSDLVGIEAETPDQQEYRKDLEYLENNHPGDITEALRDRNLSIEGTSEERVQRLIDADVRLVDQENTDKEHSEPPVSRAEEDRQEQIRENTQRIKERIEARDGGRGGSNIEQDKARRVNDIAIKWNQGQSLSSEEKNFIATNPEVRQRVEELKKNDANMEAVRARIENRIAGNKPEPQSKEVPKIVVEEHIPVEHLRAGEVPTKEVPKEKPQATPPPVVEAAPPPFTDEEKRKHADIAERLYLNEEAAVLTAAEREFYADPRNKSAIHRERTRLAQREEKFGNTMEGVGKKVKESETAIEASKAKITDERVAAAIEKMGLDLRYAHNLSPEFFDLDPDKQLYVLEKTRQHVALDATFQARARVDQTLSRKSKSIGDFFKKKWQGFTREWQETKARREVIAEAKSKGLVDYASDIETLTNHVKNMEFSLNYGPDGKLSIQYVNPAFFAPGMEFEDRFNKKRLEDMPEYVERFNRAATKLSEMPDEWRLSKFTWQKKAYNEAKRAYDFQKSIMLGAALEKYEREIPEKEKAEAAALAWMNTIDNGIQTNQLLTTHPELDAYEGKGKSFNFKDIDPADTRAYWGLGVVGKIAGGAGRMLTRTTYGLEGAAVFGMAVGGFLAGRKQWTEYTDKEKRKRYGEAGIKDRGIKRFFDSVPHIEKLSALIERFDKEEDPERKYALGAMLRNRATALDGRIAAGRVNYGNAKESLANKLTLRQKIAEAGVRAASVGAMVDSEESAVAYERLNGIQRDNRAKWMRAGGIVWAGTKGALVGGAGALAGWFIADTVGEVGSGQSTGARMKEIRYEGGEGKWNDVPEGRIPSVGGRVESVRVPVQAASEIPVGVTAPVDESIDSPGAGTTAPVNEAEPAPAPTEQAPTQQPAEQPAEQPAPESKAAPKLSSQEELAQEIKRNVREVKNAYGDMTRLEIKNPLLAEDAAKFIKNPGEFLTDDMSEWNVEEKYRTRSWGIKSLNNVRTEAKEFLAWREYSNGFPEGSPQREYATSEMKRLGEVIRTKAGPIFAPYEDMIEASSSVEAPATIAEPTVEAPAAPVESMAPVAPEQPTETGVTFNDLIEAAEQASAAKDAAPAPVTFNDIIEAAEQASGAPQPEVALAPSSLPAPEPDIAAAPEGPTFNTEIAKYQPTETGGVMDFSDKKVAGRINFIEDVNGDLQALEDKDFTTEAGRAFRANTFKYLTFEEINEIAKRENMHPRDVMNAFESFVDLREALQESDLPSDSPEALALKRRMANIESIFEDKKVPENGFSPLDRVQMVEKGGDIRNLAGTPAPVEAEPALVPEKEPSVDKINTESRIYELASEKFGPSKPVAPNILEFKDHIGFYAESSDEAIAKENALFFAKKSGLGQMRLAEEIGTKLLNGPNRYLIVYKKP